MIISAIIFIIIGLLLSYLGIHNCGLKQQYSSEELQILAFMAFIGGACTAIGVALIFILFY